MTTNPLKALTDAGQAIWLDYLHQDLMKSGDLKRLIADDGLTGLTSNPAIFEKAIVGGDAYDPRIATLLAAAKAPVRTMDLYEQIAIADIQAAADQFQPTYRRLAGRDGYVSLEVSPTLADDTAGTIVEARRLWTAVDRPNLMIKVPGTKAGVPAIRQLIGEGINVNVTLLFSIEAYLAVADAHIAGLEALQASGRDIAGVHGVASFFVSRIDTAIDKKIDEKLKAADGPAAARLKALRGKVAIANAQVAYRRYLDLVGGARWQALAKAGAAPQRLLWASTGTKDPAYSDVLYVESLIGPDTVNTMPPKTLDAFRDHGTAAATLTQGADEAAGLLAEADALGLDLAGVTDTLVEDGVEAFAKAFEDLLAAVDEKQARIAGGQAATNPAHA